MGMKVFSDSDSQFLARIYQPTASNLQTASTQNGNWTTVATQSGNWSVGISSGLVDINGGTVAATQSGAWTTVATQSGNWSVGISSGLVDINGGTVAATQSGAWTTVATQSGNWSVGVSSGLIDINGGTVAATQSGNWSVIQSGNWSVAVTGTVSVAGTVAATQSGAWTTEATQSGNWSVLVSDKATLDNSFSAVSTTAVADTTVYNALSPINVISLDKFAFLVRNTGANPATVKIQLGPVTTSADANWQDEGTVYTVANGSLAVIESARFAKYMRLAYTGNTTTMDIYYQGRV